MADLLPPHERYAAEVYAAVADMLRSNGNPLGFVETIATVLDDTIRKIELAALKSKGDRACDVSQR